ncbi:MAG: hypothetical protein WC263_00325 [Candidatus Micrarchaeia archaeon]|jgi:hypothetical protein
MQGANAHSIPMPAALAMAFSAFLLAGCCLFSEPAPPPPMSLAFSTALDPSLSVYIVDKDGARIASTYSNDYFYPVQRGLPAGTAYTFRLLRANGEVAVPANENFTALGDADEPKFQLGVQQYQGLAPGKYTLELVKLDLASMRGTVAARAKIAVVLPYDASEENIGLISNNCSRLLPPAGAAYPAVGAPEGRALYDCIRDLAIAGGDPEICKGLTKYINGSLPYIDGCVGDYAVGKGDLALCAKHGRAVDRALCRAQILGDYHECESFECDFYWACSDQQSVCLVNFGLAHANATICGMAQNGDYRNRCLGLVLHDASYCAQIMDNQSRASCFSDVD